MKLETPAGRLFSLRVERYEFPDEELGPTEDNPADEFDAGRFVVVAVSFRNADGQWIASGAEMDTIELEKFADWMESIVNRRPLSTGVCFTERNLEFTIDSAMERLFVHVSGKFLPPGSLKAEAVTIEFPMDQVDLAGAVASIRSQLKEFPSRPPLSADH